MSIYDVEVGEGNIEVSVGARTLKILFIKYIKDFVSSNAFIGTKVEMRVCG